MPLKGLLNKAFKYLTDKGYRFSINTYLHFHDKMDDAEFLKRVFYYSMNRPLDLDNPKTFNEKLQWLKLYNRKPEYTTMVDKYEAKKYVADIIGEEYIIPTYGVWDNFDDIDFDKLPEQFVLKCTHDSGGLIICRDKSKLDIKKARKTLNKSLRKNYYYANREWPYKNVKPRIIAEKYMEDNSDNAGLTDYKFFCFNGIPQFAYVSSGLENHDTANISFVTLEWEFAPFRRADYASFLKLPQKPKNIDKMIEYAKILSKDTSFLRVDFYEINNKIFFGELTFFPASGMIPFTPEEWDEKLGDMIKLSDKN